MALESGLGPPLIKRNFKQLIKFLFELQFLPLQDKGNMIYKGLL